MRASIFSLILGLLLCLAGSFLAATTQTSSGTRIEDVRIPLEDGTEIAAYLYKPSNATLDKPAPGILAVHGYINSRETQSSFAIEFARRGYVVLAIDQSGHGFSTNKAFANGFGGPAGLAYLRGLPFVDPDRIGLEGHSMGGWTSLAAAMAMPDAYQSVALVGSSTGAPFAAPGTAEWPRNLAVIFSLYDEFSKLMWDVDRAADAPSSAKLKAVFGTSETIRPNEVYGDIANGSARRLTQPRATHPGDHLSFVATADALSWMDQTIGDPRQLKLNDQIWHHKEIGTLLGFIGAVMLLIGVFSMLNLAGIPLQKLQRVDPPHAPSGLGFWGALLLGLIIPALSFYPLTALGAQLPNFGIFRQNITNQIMVWAVGNGLIALIGLVIARQFRFRFSMTGIVSALVAIILVYGLSVLMSVALHVDFRFWVVALKPMAAHHWPLFLAYFLPFLIFFYLSHAAQLQLFGERRGAISQFALAWLLSAGGMTLLIGGVYAGLFADGKLPGFADPLFSIVGIQFVPILTITAIIAVTSWRTCRAVFPGAFLSAILVTWYIVAGQATHL